jgi:hypothetical protein
MRLALNEPSGKLLPIEKAKRGIACQCICLECGRPVITKKGFIRGWHYACTGERCFPGAPFASAQHYLLWGKGNTPLRSRLFTPVLVDARNGWLSAVVKMPWYLRTLEVSRPLHLGDYGGMPLKVIWAIFDLVMIAVLISGLYLWWVRRKLYKAYFSRILDGGEAVTA